MKTRFSQKSNMAAPKTIMTPVVAIRDILLGYLPMCLSTRNLLEGLIVGIVAKTVLLRAHSVSIGLRKRDRESTKELSLPKTCLADMKMLFIWQNRRITLAAQARGPGTSLVVEIGNHCGIVCDQTNIR